MTASRYADIPSSDGEATLRRLVAGGQWEEAYHHFTGMDATQQSESESQLWAGVAAARLGRFGTAYTLAKSAEEGLGARGNHPDALRALNLLGAIAFELGKIDEAETRLREVLRRATAANDPAICAHAALNLGSILDLRGEADGAILLYYEALHYYGGAEDHRGMAQAYHNLNLVFRRQGMLEAADSVARLAVRHAELQHDPGLTALCLSGEAETRLERPDLTGAQLCLGRAQVYARTADDDSCTAEIGRLLAWLHIREGRVSEGVAEAEISRRLARRCGSALLAAECAATAALGLRIEGRVPEATHREDEALRGFAELRSPWLRDRYAHAWSTACKPCD